MTKYKLKKSEENVLDSIIEKSSFKVDFTLEDVKNAVQENENNKVKITKMLTDQKQKRDMVGSRNPAIVTLVTDMELEKRTAFTLYLQAMENYALTMKKKDEVDGKLKVEAATMQNIQDYHPEIVKEILAMDAAQRKDFMDYDSPDRFCNEAERKLADIDKNLAEQEEEIKEITAQTGIAITRSEKGWAAEELKK